MFNCMMGRVWAASLVVVCGLLAAGASGSMSIAVEPMMDAPISVNYDFNDPLTPHIDPYNWYSGVLIGYATEGREEPHRPAPGVITEERFVMEFDLAGLLAATDPIDTATLAATVSNPMPGGTIDVLVWGYAGDGSLEASDFGTLDWPLDGGTYSFLGEWAIVGPGTVSFDVTGFIQDLVATARPYAGIVLQPDGADLPPRGSFVGDQDFGWAFVTADQSPGPQLDITFVPEPATLTLLAAGVLAVRRRRRA